MKKLFIFLLLGLFLVSFASAAEWDNVKTYSEDLRVVTITNGLGFGEVIGQAWLKSPINVNIPRGYQKVAEFDIWAYEDYNDALKQFSFEDMRNGREKINRDYDLKKRSYEDVEVIDYKIECYLNPTNGTEICDQVQNGTHTEQRETWTKVTPADLKKNEVLTIGVFTEVRKGDYVDWVPMIYGVKVPEWATWTEDLNSGIRLYYKLDDDLATTKIIDFFGGNNGTINGGSNSEDISTAGKINLSMNFSGATDEIESNINTGISGNENWTESFWVKFPNTDAETSSHFLTYFGAATPNDDAYVFLPSGTTDLRIGANGVGATTIASKSTDWQHIVITYDGTTIRSYVNGTTSGTLAAALTLTGSHLAIGSKLGTNYVDDAMVDEYGLWDRVLSASELSDLWNNGNGITPTEEVGISLSKPTSYRMYQRDNDTTGEIYIEGTFSGSAAGIEGSFNGGAYQTFNASPSGGVFSGFINGSVGNGTLTVRFTNETTVNTTVSNIGVGDIFLVAGQSNNVGHGDTNNVFNTSNGFATMYQANDNLALLSDPTDSTAGDGSAWPIAANYLMNSSDGIPVMFITASVGGTAISTWIEGAANYEAAKTQVGEITDGNYKISSVLFFQGETDIVDGTSYANYYSRVNNMSNGFTRELDLRDSVILGQVDHTAVFTRDDVNNIRRAQRDAWNNNSNITRGPITHDILLSSGGAHFETDQEMGAFAYRWFEAINRTVYSDSEVSPTISSIFFNQGTENITITLNTPVNEFSIWNSSSSAISEAFLFHYLSTVYDSSDIASMTISGNEIEIDLTPSINSSYDITFGGGYDAYGESIPRKTNSLPLDPSWNITMNTIETIDVTLNNPADSATFDIPLINVSCSAENDLGVTELNLTIDGTTNQTITNSTPLENLTISQELNFSEGSYDWSCEARNTNITGESGNRSFTVTYSSPVVTLILPANNSNITDASVNFTFTATDNNGINNVTLFINEILNETNSSGVNGSYLFSKTLADGYYNWSVRSASILGKVTNSLLGTFLMHTVEPSINISEPSGILGYFLLGGNETLVYNISEGSENPNTHLDNCTYGYNGINNTLNCTETTINFTYVVGQNLLTVYAEDEHGLVSSNTTTWGYNLTEVLQTSPTVSVESSTETYTSNVNYNSSAFGVITGLLILNGTEYTGDRTGIGDNATFSTDAIMPGITTETNFTSYWTVSLTDASGTTNYNLTSRNVSVSLINISLCDANNNVSFWNFTVLNETNLVEINSTFAATFAIRRAGSTSDNEFSFLDSTGTNSTFDFCISPGGINYTADASIKLTKSGFVDKFYNYQEVSLSNSTTEDSLYMMATADSTSFIVHTVYVDSSDLTGAEVRVQRYYQGTGTWATTEILTTNYVGEAIGHLLAEDADYRFLVYVGGELIYTSSATKITCSVSPCTVTLTIPIDVPTGVEILEDFVSTLTYSDTTNIFTYTYSDTSGDFTASRLYVELLAPANATKLIVCNETKGDFSGVITCDITGQINGTYQASGYLTRDEEVLDRRINGVLGTNIYNAMGNDGILWAFFIMIAIVMLGINRPSLAIVLGVIGLIVVSLLGIIKVGAASIIAITAIAIILLMRIGKE